MRNTAPSRLGDTFYLKEICNAAYQIREYFIFSERVPLVRHYVSLLEKV